MSYPDLFKRALALWWRTRALWPLGVLAAIFGAGDYSSGGLNSNFNVNLPAGSDPSTALPPDFVDRWASSPALQSLIENPLPFVAGAVALLLAWSLAAALIGQLAHGAMIRMADVADQGYEASLRDALGVGSARLLPMFLLAVLVALPVVLAVVVAGVILVTLIVQLIAAEARGLEPQTSLMAGLGGALLCAIPLVLLALAVTVALSFFSRVAQRACVLEGLGPIASLRRSWRLVTRNFGGAVLTWLATMVLGAIFGFVASLPALAIALPAIFGFMRGGDVPWGALLALAIYGIAVSALLGGWLTSFNSALWTLLYRSCVAQERPTSVAPAPYPAGD